MTPFVVAILIALCGAIVGAMLMWWYMDWRVEFWRDKAELEQGLKERLIEQNLESLNRQLSIFNDLRGAFGEKKS